MIRVNDLNDLETMNPEPILEYPGFFYCPLDRRLGVSKEGLVKNVKTGNIIAPHLSPDRFQKELHFMPKDTTGMDELSFMERFELLQIIEPTIGYYHNPWLSSTKTDIECLLDNNRIPTHREKDVTLGYACGTVPDEFYRELIHQRNTVASLNDIRPLCLVEKPSSYTDKNSIIEIDFNKAKETKNEN